jgi:hypothetical protein
MACGFVVSLMLPERPLRDRAGISDAMEAQATSAGAPAVAAAAAVDPMVEPLDDA